jgi:competence protein ComEC
LTAALLGILAGAAFGFLSAALCTAAAIVAAVILRAFGVKPVLLLMLCFASGYALGALRLNASLEHLEAYELPAEVNSATVLRIEKQANRQRITAAFDAGQSALRAHVYAPAFPEVLPGDRIRLRCDLEKPEPFDGFRYDFFLASKHIYATCFSRSLEIEAREAYPLRSIAAFRAVIDDRIERRFSLTNGSLLSGLYYGERQFSERQDEIYLRTGTTHIVAASGYNVTLVATLLMSFLSILLIPRRIALIFVACGIAAFVAFVGFDAPIVRAGIMGGIVLFARFLGRSASFHNVLLFAGAVMAIMSPLIVRYDVGFQLSLLSTFGLMTLSRRIEPFFHVIPKAFTLRESLVSTCAATLITLPIILTSFKAISFISPLANLFVLPLLPYAMFFGAFAIVLPEPIALFGVLASEGILRMVHIILQELSSISFVYKEIDATWQAGIALAASTCILLLWFRKPHSSEQA